MNPAAFQDAVDRFGSELMAWPADLQQQARDFLDHSAAAKVILEEADALRRALANSDRVRAPRGLADRIVFAALGADAAPQSLPALDARTATGRPAKAKLSTRAVAR